VLIFKVAMLVSLLDQNPPLTELVNVDPLPRHVFNVPEIVPADEVGFIESVVVANTVPQEVETVYVIITEPEEIPDTTPPVSDTVAIAAEELLQVPPLGLPVSVV
jgi:hypothetical protein